MLKKNDSPTPRSHKEQKRRTVIALSVGTCLIMGILAMEVLRRQESAPLKLSQEPKETLILLKNPDDLKAHRDLTLLESRIHDSKRLLFSKENALETERVKALRERLNHAEAYVQQLEQRHDQLKEALQQEKQKVADYDRAQIALVESIELHKSEKSNGRQQLIAQIEALQQEFAQEKASLEKALSDQAASAAKLREEIENREYALSEMKDLSSQKENALARHQDESARLQESRQGLSQEVEALRTELEDQVHATATLEQELRRTHDIYADKIEELTTRLERTQGAWRDLNDSYTSLLQNNQQLTAQLSERETALENLAGSYEMQRQDKTAIALASDQQTSHAARLLAEKEDTIALEQAYSELALYRTRQQAQKVEEDRQALEQNLQDLRQLLADKQNQAESLASLLERNKSEIHELKQRLEVEKAQSEQLRFTLEHRPPERDLARESALEVELAQEREAAETLKSTLSEERDAIQRVQKEIALLENALLDSRSQSQGLTANEQSLREEMAALEEKLQKERAEQEELREKLSQESASREALKTRLAELQSETDQKGEGWSAREKELHEESDKLAKALENARQESERLSEILAAERGHKEELEQEISNLNVRINNLGLSREDNEQAFQNELNALNTTLAEVRKEAEASLASLEEEQRNGSQLRREIEALQKAMANASDAHQEREGTLNGVIARMNEDLESLKAALSRKEDEFAESVAVRHEVQDTAGNLMRRLEALNQEKQALEEQAQNRFKEYEGKLAMMDETSSDLKGSLAEQANQRALLERELTELHARHEELELEVSKLRYSLHDLESRPPVRDTAKEEALQAELNAKEKELLDLKNSLEALEKKAESALDQAARHEETLSRLNNSSEHLQNSLNQLAQEKATLERDLDRLNREYETALLDADEAKKTLREWQSRPIERDTSKEEALQAELNAKENELLNLKSSIEALEKRTESALDQAARHEETLSRLNDSSEQLQNSLNRLSQEKSTLEGALDRLKGEYETALLEADAAKKALREWESRPVERDTSKEEALETLLREKEGEVNRMREALDSLQGRVSKLSQDKEKLKNRLAKLRKATPAN